MPLYPDDVPVERGRVLARVVGNGDDQYPFKRYVYRGDGTDQLERGVIFPWNREPVPVQVRREPPGFLVQARARAARRKAREKVQAAAAAWRAQQEAQAAWLAEQREQERREQERRERAAQRERKRLALEKIREDRERKRQERMAPLRNLTKPRPAPGWRPMNGADVEAMLEELAD